MLYMNIKVLLLLMFSPLFAIDKKPNIEEMSEDEFLSYMSQHWMDDVEYSETPPLADMIEYDNTSSFMSRELSENSFYSYESEYSEKTNSEDYIIKD